MEEWMTQGLRDSGTELINDKGVCRTAPATPGLLNIYTNVILVIVVMKVLRHF